MYLISYDICGDKKRRNIAKELENYGKRVQYSVFECDLDKSKFDELYQKLKRCKIHSKESHSDVIERLLDSQQQSSD